MKRHSLCTLSTHTELSKLSIKLEEMNADLFVQIHKRKPIFNGGEFQARYKVLLKKLLELNVRQK